MHGCDMGREVGFPHKTDHIAIKQVVRAMGFEPTNSLETSPSS